MSSTSSFFVSTNLLEKLTNATITPTTCDGDSIILDNQQPTQEVKEQTIDRNNSTDSSEESFYSSPSLDAMTINNTVDAINRNDDKQQQYTQSRHSSSSSIYGYGDDIPSRVAEAMKFNNIISSITSNKTDMKKRVMNDMSRLSGVKSKKE